MSTTMTLTMSPPPDRDISCCPNCGIGLSDSSAMLADAQRRIEDLEAQVRLLNQKCTSAVDKWADYEDEIQQLKSQQTQRNSTSSDSDRPETTRQSYQNRLSSLLTGRKSQANLKALPAPPPTPSAPELIAALSREQELRKKAEEQLDGASGELEELSAQLFMQANEMVATERKARAKLEERVAVLESRDGEKRKRLEKLEGAVARIERVRNLLAPGK